MNAGATNSGQGSATEITATAEEEVAVDYFVQPNGKPAGDFNLYNNKCELLNAGWKIFRPESYEFNLV